MMRDNTKRWLGVVMVVLTGSLLVYFKLVMRTEILNFENVTKTAEADNRHKFALWDMEVRRTRACFANYFHSVPNAFTMHSLITKICSQIILERFLRLKFAEGMDELKVYIPFNSNSKNKNNCVQVTLGIGNDISAEKVLRKLYPQCKFFGADPLWETGAVFQEIGNFFQTGIAAKSGHFYSPVLENGVYRSKQIMTTNFVDFISDAVKHKFIDFLWIDNEGAEFEILKQFSHGGAVDSAHIVACQVNVELHAILEKFYMNPESFRTLALQLIENSDYLPIYSFGFGHVRVFYINTENLECLEKFIQDDI